MLEDFLISSSFLRRNHDQDPDLSMHLLENSPRDTAQNFSGDKRSQTLSENEQKQKTMNNNKVQHE